MKKYKVTLNAREGVAVATLAKTCRNDRAAISAARSAKQRWNASGAEHASEFVVRDPRGRVVGYE